MSRISGWLLPAALLVLLALTFKPVIENDGIGYFSYLHSVVVDHDLDFTNEYQAVKTERVSYFPALIETRTATGSLADFFPVGPAILASPAYLAALAAKPSAEPQFGPPFSSAFTLASLLFGLLALVLAYRLAETVTGPRAAVIGVAGAAAATPFVYYLLYEPSYSHSFSAFAVAAFLYVWLRGRDRRSWQGWALLGLLGGLMGLIRFQDGPLLLIGLLERPRRPWHLLVFFGAAALAFAPQLAVDQVLFAGWLPARPPGQDLEPFPGHYLPVLLSSQHGLFSWTPIALAAAAGYWFVPDRRLQLAFLYAFLVELLVSGAAPDWFGGFSFGMRRFLGLTPFLAIGLAAIAERIPPRLAWAAVIVFTAWNLVLMANLTYVINSSGDPGYRGLLRGQLPALRFLPHLVTQGAAGRALIWWPVLKLRFDPIYGSLLLLGEAACLAVSAGALRILGPPASPPAAGPRAVRHRARPAGTAG